MPQFSRRTECDVLNEDYQEHAEGIEDGVDGNRCPFRQVLDAIGNVADCGENVVDREESRVSQHRREHHRDVEDLDSQSPKPEVGLPDAPVNEDNEVERSDCHGSNEQGLQEIADASDSCDFERILDGCVNLSDLVHDQIDDIGQNDHGKTEETANHRPKRYPVGCVLGETLCEREVFLQINRHSFQDETAEEHDGHSRDPVRKMFLNSAEFWQIFFHFQAFARNKLLLFQTCKARNG